MCSKVRRADAESLQCGDPKPKVLPVIVDTSQPTALRPRRLALFVLVTAPLFALYLATARTDLPYHIDPATNVFTAWTIGTTGSPILTEYGVLADPTHKGVFGWVVDSRRGPISQYPPGAALLTAPLYAVVSGADPISLSADNTSQDVRVTVPIPSFWPAAIVAAAATAAALGFVALTVREAGGSTRLAVWTALIGGIGTSAWTIAADGLWQHGPNMLWVAAGVYLASRERWGWAGLAFAALVLTRPPVVLVGIALGTMLVAQRRFRPAVMLLAGTAPGVVALLAYNAWLFESPSISGGYGTEFTERAISAGIGPYLANIGAGLFDPRHGLLIWAPFVTVAVVAIAPVLKGLPAWSLAAAIGGVLYLLLQWRMNRASGGEGFFYYRYPLETLTASAVVLASAGARLWHCGGLRRILFGIALAVAIVAHAVEAL